MSVRMDEQQFVPHSSEAAWLDEVLTRVAYGCGVGLAVRAADFCFIGVADSICNKLLRVYVVSPQAEFKTKICEHCHRCLFIVNSPDVWNALN